MSAGRIIAYVAAAIFIGFGVLFVLATFGPEGNLGYIPIGLILIATGFGLVWLAGRAAKRDQQVEVIQKIDLSGEINLESLTCQQCGGTLSSENVTMVAGAPVVNCPYCSASYQLTEEPKW